MSIFSIIGAPLGWIMYMIYQFVQNYGIALIIFTVLMRIIFIPLSIKQQKGTIAMAKMKPKMDEIQKKYGNNKEKLNEELMLLYQKEKYSPLSSCLPMLLQFPLLFGLIDVIYYPLKHMLRLPKDVIATATQIATDVLGAAGMSKYSTEISVINAVKISPEPFTQALGSDITNHIRNFDFSFFGMDLGATPTMMPTEGQDISVYIVLLMIPIISGITSFALSHLTSKTNPAMASQQTAGMNSTMMLMMPLMSVYIAFQVPAGVGLYWLMTNIIMILQTIALNKFMNPVKIIAQAEADMTAEREKEREDRILAKKKAKEDVENGVAPEKPANQKEVNKQRLAQARKKDAEKYGEEYADAPDND